MMSLLETLPQPPHLCYDLFTVASDYLAKGKVNMYRTVRVQRFRGFRDLEISGLTRINLIGGKNNVGKTSLLEALSLFMNPYDGERWTHLNAFRGLIKLQIQIPFDRSNTALDSLFHEFDTNQEIQLSGEHSQQSYDFLFSLVKNSYRVVIDPNNQTAKSIMQVHVQNEIDPDQSGKIDFSIENGKINIFSPRLELRHPNYFFNSTVREGFNVVAERYSALVEEGQEALIIRALQSIEPRIQSARLLQKYGEIMLHVDLGDGKSIPIMMMGDGMNRFLQLILTIGNARDGVVLIDEIENGLHYSTYGKVWEVIASTAELFNVQIFTTTHSFEMIESAHETFKAREEDTLFRYHRLDRRKTGDIKLTTYPPDTMKTALEMDFEVR